MTPVGPDAAAPRCSDLSALVTRAALPDIVSVPPQPRHASLNGGEPRSNADSLATAMFARMRWVSWRFSRSVAERRDGG